MPTGHFRRMARKCNLGHECKISVVNVEGLVCSSCPLSLSIGSSVFLCSPCDLCVCSSCDLSILIPDASGSEAGSLSSPPVVAAALDSRDGDSRLKNRIAQFKRQAGSSPRSRLSFLASFESARSAKRDELFSERRSFHLTTPRESGSVESSPTIMDSDYASRISVDDRRSQQDVVEGASSITVLTVPKLPDYRHDRQSDVDESSHENDRVLSKDVSPFHEPTAYAQNDRVLSETPVAPHAPSSNAENAHESSTALGIPATPPRIQVSVSPHAFGERDMDLLLNSNLPVPQLPPGFDAANAGSVFLPPPLPPPPLRAETNLSDPNSLSRIQISALRDVMLETLDIKLAPLQNTVEAVAKCVSTMNSQLHETHSIANQALSKSEEAFDRIRSLESQPVAAQGGEAVDSMARIKIANV